MVNKSLFEMIPENTGKTTSLEIAKISKRAHRDVTSLIDRVKVSNKDNRMEITLSFYHIRRGAARMYILNKFAADFILKRYQHLDSLKDVSIAPTATQEPSEPVTPKDRNNPVDSVTIKSSGLVELTDNDNNVQIAPRENSRNEMKCKTCIWFVVKSPTFPQKGGEEQLYENGRVGRCRRHAPTMNGYPVCFENDWCGDHKMSENLS